jgi:hypothetical protein
MVLNVQTRGVRSWVVGLACIACGVAGRIAYSCRVTPTDRLQGIRPAGILALFFGVGLVLASVPVVRKLYSPGDPTRFELLGCLLLSIGAFAAFVFVLSMVAP